MSRPSGRTVKLLACLALAGTAASAGILASGSRADSPGAAPAPGSFRQNDFATDPAWLGYQNRRGSCTTRTFAFGWKNSTNASSTPGELGGRFERSNAYRAYYAEQLPAPENLDDHLSVSGTVRVRSPNGGGVLLGWFDSATSYDWRTPNFLGIRIDGSSRARLYAEYGTTNTFTSADTIDAGVWLEPKLRYDFTLEYFPDQGQDGTGLLRLTLVSPRGSLWTAEGSIPAAQRADGATFDHFGLLNVQLDGHPMTAYVGNLVIDGVPVDLTSAPPWDASNNTLTKAVDCIIHGHQSFGYSATQLAGGGPGEIGGLVWRVAQGRAWYGDAVGPLGLGDTLYAEGRIDLESAAPDSDVFIGWFNSSTGVKSGYGDTPTNLVAADIGGPSQWGYRLFPVYHASGTHRGAFSSGSMASAPMLTPKHHPWQWWICYRPGPDATSDGLLTVGLVDPSGQRPPTRAAITVPAVARAEGASLDRFGIRNLEEGGHDVVFYLDDLRYTVGPGDVGPADRCS